MGTLRPHVMSSISMGSKSWDYFGAASSHQHRLVEVDCQSLGLSAFSGLTCSKGETANGLTCGKPIPGSLGGFCNLRFPSGLVSENLLADWSAKYITEAKLSSFSTHFVVSTSYVRFN